MSSVAPEVTSTERTPHLVSRLSPETNIFCATFENARNDESFGRLNVTERVCLATSQISVRSDFLISTSTEPPSGERCDEASSVALWAKTSLPVPACHTWKPFSFSENSVRPSPDQDSAVGLSWRFIT